MGKHKRNQNQYQSNKLDKCFFCMLIFLVILTLGTKNINAISTGNESPIEKSDEFKKWEALSEEERNKTMQPEYGTRTFEEIINTPNLRMYKFNSILKAGTDLPSKYSLNRSKIKVKNQQAVGSCWAFAFSSMTETTAFNKYNVEKEYSPEHIDYKVAKMYNTRVGNGGNYYLSTAYAAAGYGPVYESDFPFESVYDTDLYTASSNYLKNKNKVNTDIEPKIMAKDIKSFAKIYKEYSNDSVIYKNNSGSITPTGSTRKYSSDEVQTIREDIKQHIVNNGAIGAYMYCDIDMDKSGNLSSDGNYFESSTNAYYCDDTSASVDHAVTIVGWDDNYSRTNFNSENQPKNNGAYIVLNSWGENALDEGYFYISYDDVFIEANLFGIEDVEIYNNSYTESYDNLYQYDELGESNALSFDSTSGYMANIFERKDTSKREKLNAVGIYLWNSEDVDIYINKTGDLDIENAKKVASINGLNTLSAGYHKINLDSAVTINGDKFAIIVKYISRTASKATAPVECNLKSVGLTNVSNYFDAVTSSRGESFISEDGDEWEDFYDIYDINTKKSYENTNACIKAFTKYASDTDIDFGDVNQDGSIDITDVFLIKRHVVSTMIGDNDANWMIPQETQYLADVNEDGVVDITDIYQLKVKVLSEL